jgi:hypothetical protein
VRPITNRLLWCVIACNLVVIGVCTLLRHTSRTVYVHSPQLASSPGIRLLDPNVTLFEIVRSEPNRIVVQWLETEVHVPNVCRVRLCGDERVQVMGRVNDTREYPVTLDTGYDGYLLVTDTVVRESQLEVYPFAGIGPCMGGYCRIDQFHIGQVAIARPMAVYLLGHYEKQILGRPTWTEKKIMLGLKVMSLFAHIIIDNVQDEVLFAMEEPFVPPDPNRWRRYPMNIREEPSIHKELLWVDIPLAGEVRSVALDTGADLALTISQANWQSLSQEFPPLRQRKGRVRRPYGWDKCQVMTLEGLDIAGMSPPRAEVYVNDSYAGGWCLGMGFFTETVLVLDFKSGLLWIRDTDAEPASGGTKT